MKQTIIVIVALFLVAGTVEASKKKFVSVPTQKVAEIITAQNNVEVHKFMDGTVTCYVSLMGNGNMHTMSCVK